MDDLNYSEGSEGSALREHVDRWQAQTTNAPSDGHSPRDSLLSPESQSEENSLTRRRRSRASSRRYTKRGEYASYTTKELAKILAEEEYEVRELRRAYNHALDRIEAESQRAAYAEQRVLDLGHRLREANDLRISAELDAARGREEVALYKIQYEAAQREILRAQDIVKDVEAKREDAEAAAARARKTARMLKEEKMINLAREEGRRIGFEEGLRTGRSMGYEEGRSVGYDDGRVRTDGDEYEDVRRIIDEDGDEGVEEYGEEGEGEEGVEGDGGGYVRTNTPVRASPMPDPVQPIPTRPSPSSLLNRMPSQAPIPSRSPIPNQNADFTPIPIHNPVPSPRHAPIVIPPDNWIPTSGGDGYIHVPPAHEMGPNANVFGQERLARNPSPAPPPLPPKSDTSSAGRPLLTRDFTNQLHAQPSIPGLAHSETSNPSLSSRGMGSLGLSNFRSPGPAAGMAVGGGAGRLSVIDEGVSERGSVRGGRYGGPPQERGGYARDGREEGVYTKPYEGSPARSNRELGDPYQGRGAGPEPPRQDHYYSHRRPAHLSTPAPLAPETRHQRSFSAASPRRAPAGLALGAGGYHRRTVSTDAAPAPDISIQSPTPETSRRTTMNSSSRLASPNPSYLTPSPLGRSSQLPPQSSPRHVPPNLMPGGRSPSRLSNASPRQNPVPVPAPIFPGTMPPTHEPIYMRPLASPISRSATPQQPLYANPLSNQQQPIYTHPNRSRSQQSMSRAGSDSVWSPRPLQVPLNTSGAGNTPGAPFAQLPTYGEKPRLKKVSSASSLGSRSSYGRYDPSRDLDPSTFVESELVKDPRDTLSPQPKMTRLRSPSPGKGY
ncbi:hypothetical protein NEOLEDRAFT_1152676 [Neolentinus lepideus HHB14362 ss-1]|uniref:Uncharacterized protein n=1 Tax=Neolentinus lepideus HHB14362 ss-1 TaxID=1314782 RepID=A0A165MGL3_9AGAM|nr:hypothetical protein NEOLEDRAFT_1152676 [Neolentinus lepideus HHB14362 ss-1]